MPGDARSRRATLLAAAAAAALSAVPLLALRDFTVDDALIPARYALSLARGEGYRPSVGAPPTDGVTPLGFAHLLAPFAREGVLAAHDAARVIGAAAWLAAAAALGATIARLGGARRRFAALGILATSAPVAGWAVSGLETGLVIAIVGAALALREAGWGRAGALCLGIAAGWRPELAPAALVLAFAAGPRVGDGGATEGRPAARALRVALSAAPFVVVALCRLAWFGRVAPLSVHAKVPDPGHGATYAVAAALLAGVVAVGSRAAATGADPWARALALAALVHVGAMAFAGGDWMPLARLAAPIAPVVVLASARGLAGPAPALGALSLALAIGLQIFGFWRAFPAVHAVGSARRALIEEMRPWLASSRVVATVDVGWVGAAAEHARLVDLAGVTDPEIAALPHGHTSRRLPRAWLDDRDVDTVVLLLAPGEARAGEVPWNELAFARWTERGIARTAGVDAELELRHASATSLRYVVLRRPARPR